MELILWLSQELQKADDLKIWNKARKDYESDDDPRRN